MKSTFLIILSVVLFFLSGCTTTYYGKFIDYQGREEGKAFPEWYISYSETKHNLSTYRLLLSNYSYYFDAIKKVEKIESFFSLKEAEEFISSFQVEQYGIELVKRFILNKTAITPFGASDEWFAIYDAWCADAAEYAAEFSKGAAELLDIRWMRYRHSIFHEPVYNVYTYWQLDDNMIERNALTFLKTVPIPEDPEYAVTLERLKMTFEHVYEAEYQIWWFKSREYHPR